MGFRRADYGQQHVGKDCRRSDNRAVPLTSRAGSGDLVWRLRKRRAKKDDLVCADGVQLPVGHGDAGGQGPRNPLGPHSRHNARSTGVERSCLHVNVFFLHGLFYGKILIQQACRTLSLVCLVLLSVLSSLCIFFLFPVRPSISSAL